MFDWLTELFTISFKISFDILLVFAFASLSIITSCSYSVCLVVLFKAAFNLLIAAFFVSLFACALIVPSCAAYSVCFLVLFKAAVNVFDASLFVSFCAISSAHLILPIVLSCFLLLIAACSRIDAGISANDPGCCSSLSYGATISSDNGVCLGLLVLTADEIWLLKFDTVSVALAIVLFATFLILDIILFTGSLGTGICGSTNRDTPVLFPPAILPSPANGLLELNSDVSALSESCTNLTLPRVLLVGLTLLETLFIAPAIAPPTAPLLPLLANPPATPAIILPAWPPPNTWDTPVATPPAIPARVIIGTDAATPLAAPPAIPLKPLAAKPSAAPAKADSAATDTPPVTAPKPIEVAKLTKLVPSTSLYGYVSIVSL